MIKWFEPYFWGQEKDFVLRSLESSWISGGSYVIEFEKTLSSILKVPYVLSVSNGTSALHLAFLTLGIGAGDEVLVPGFCFAAAVNIIIALGACPVYVDIDINNWCISQKELEKLCTFRTKALVVVHNYGNMGNMEHLMTWAKRKKIFVIEDAAEALFSKQNGIFAGTFADIGIFSFHATKTITTGEGGAIALHSHNLYEKAALIRSHGMIEGQPYWHYALGQNFRLTNMQAAMGCAQLLHWRKICEIKKSIWSYYKSILVSCPHVVFQVIDSTVEPVIWAVSILLKIGGDSRGKIREQMKRDGIETRPGFYSFNLNPLYSCEAELPVSTFVSKNIISLPSSLSMTNEKIEYVCEKLERALYNEI